MASLVLALDTSTPVLSAALLRRDGARLEILATRAVPPPTVSSTQVPGVFDELLADAGARIDDVGVLAAGLGPGLFTGARVTVAAMKAIAFARELPLVGAGTLEAMALAAARGSALKQGDSVTTLPPAEKLLCPVLDARKGEVYVAVYRLAGGLPEVVVAPDAGPPARIRELIAGLGADVEIFGTRLSALGELPSNAIPRSEPQTPGAAELAVIALHRTPSPVFDLAAVLSLEPTYLRPPEAEVARRKREQPAS